MIIDVPIGEVERRLEPITDAIFKLMPKVEYMRVRLAIAATVKLPCDPVFQFQFTLAYYGDLVSKGEVTFSPANLRARTNDERERDGRNQTRQQPRR